MASHVEVAPSGADRRGRPRADGWRELPLEPPRTIGPEVPTAMRWGAVSLALLAATTVEPTARTVGAGAIAVSYAAVRTAFPIAPSPPDRRLLLQCGGEMAVALLALFVAGGWASPLLLVLGAAALTSGLLGGARCVAACGALVGGGAIGTIVVGGLPSRGLEATVVVTLVGAVGAYGRRLQRVAMRRVATESGVRSALQERERIARELHDRLGQSVAMVALALDRLAVSWPATDDGRGAASELRLLAADVRDASRQVRATLHDLAVPRRGAEVGAALAAHVGRVVARGLVRPHLELDDDGTLPDAVAEDLFQIAKEALANVERHARARSASVRLMVRRGRALVAIEDDGAGFSPGATEGTGIASMRQRAAAIGGTFKVSSSCRGVAVELDLGWDRP